MLVVLIVFTACENDLDTAPEDRFTAGSFYKNASDIDAAVNAAYGGLQKNGLYGFNYHILILFYSITCLNYEPYRYYIAGLSPFLYIKYLINYNAIN